MSDPWITQTDRLKRLHQALGLPASALAADVTAIEEACRKAVDSIVEVRAEAVNELHRQIEQAKKTVRKLNEVLGGSVAEIEAKLLEADADAEVGPRSLYDCRHALSCRTGKSSVKITRIRRAVGKTSIGKQKRACQNTSPQLSSLHSVMMSGERSYEVGGICMLAASADPSNRCPDAVPRYSIDRRSPVRAAKGTCRDPRSCRSQGIGQNGRDRSHRRDGCESV